MAESVLSAAGLAHAALRIGTGHKVGTADAFIIKAAVVRTFFVGHLQIRASIALSVTFFLAGFIVVALAGGIFAVTGRPNTIIRLMTFFEVVVTNTSLKIRRINRTKVLTVGK